MNKNATFKIFRRGSLEENCEHGAQMDAVSNWNTSPKKQKRFNIQNQMVAYSDAESGKKLVFSLIS